MIEDGAPIPSPMKVPMNRVASAVQARGVEVFLAISRMVGSASRG